MRVFERLEITDDLNELTLSRRGCTTDRGLVKFQNCKCSMVWRFLGFSPPKAETLQI